MVLVGPMTKVRNEERKRTPLAVFCSLPERICGLSCRRSEGMIGWWRGGESGSG